MATLYIIGDGTLNPSYYNCEGGDIIDLMGTMFGRDMQIGFINGNILKYIKRWNSKDGVKDLHKAREYLDRLIDIIEMEGEGEENVCKE